jgi:hypothetical protein
VNRDFISITYHLELTPNGYEMVFLNCQGAHKKGHSVGKLWGGLVTVHKTNNNNKNKIYKNWLNEVYMYCNDI